MTKPARVAETDARHTFAVEDDDVQVSQPEKKSPDDWAKLVFPASAKAARTGEHWKHAAAEQLHGWLQHAHHEGAPIQLTRSEYESALEAASDGPLQPHKPAMSKHAPLAQKA